MEDEDNKVTPPEGDGVQVHEEDPNVLKTEITRLEGELKKFQDKDYNFNALRNRQLGDLSPEEKEKILADKLGEIEEKQAEYRTSQRTERIDDALDVFAGDDEERKKFAFYFENDKRSEKAVSAKDIQKLMKEYMPLVKGNSAMEDSFNRAASHYGGAPMKQEDKSFAESDRGKQLSKELGLDNDILRQAAGLGLKVNNPNK